MKQDGTTFESDEARWEAVLRRDDRGNGEFYYSVKTTGVYCLPSCPARLPRRENVGFHETCQDAEAAGFRPCKRCRPNGDSLGELQAAAVARACRMIASAEEPPSLGQLAEAAGVSAFHFHRIFKNVTGLTPKAYSSAHRAMRMRDGLARSGTVTEAIYQAGFNSNGRFYAQYPEILGMAPGTFRKGGKGEVIRFAVGQCSLGSILVASSEKGICAILLGDDPQALAFDLQNRFAKAELIGGDADFEQWVATVVGMVESPGHGLKLPLDIRGTVFQQRVWQALREIPGGTTDTYTGIARKIGMPKAARAVAGACAANPLAIAIPCHRVIRTNGSLSGYRWGIERKRALLDREVADHI